MTLQWTEDLSGPGRSTASEREDCAKNPSTRLCMDLSGCRLRGSVCGGRSRSAKANVALLLSSPTKLLVIFLSLVHPNKRYFNFTFHGVD